MSEMQNLEVVKSGICWFELGVGRGSKGLEISLKAVPQLEEFFQGLSGGKKDPIELYGRNWSSGDNRDLEIYGLQRDLQLENANYFVNRPTEPLEEDGRGSRLNLSFLRLVGISDPQGVKFVISGPYSKEYTRVLTARIGAETRNLIRDFVVPVYINLRISSQDI